MARTIKSKEEMDLLKNSGYLTLSALIKKNFFPTSLKLKHVIYRGKAYYDINACKPIIDSTNEKRIAPALKAKPVSKEYPKLFYIDNCVRCLSRSAWLKENKKVPNDAKPYATISGRIADAKMMQWEVFPEYLCVEKETKKVIPPKKIEDIALCVFAVNRATKRYRDSATQHFLKGNHGFAGFSKYQKLFLYALKDTGLMYLFSKGQLDFKGISGSLGLWSSDVYSFHASFAPKGALSTASDADKEIIKVESKPHNKKIPRLKDAIFTLDDIKINEDEFLSLYNLERLELPTIKKNKKPTRINWKEIDFYDEDYDGY